MQFRQDFALQLEVIHSGSRETRGKGKSNSLGSVFVVLTFNLSTFPCV
jgi:hypothetical protein